MALIHLPAAKHTTMPWKNGLGVSRIIATDPAGAGFDTMLWQLSGTEIGADCPFSEHEGLNRLFMVTDGAGVDLTSTNAVSGRTWTARVAVGQAPYAFRGAWKTSCRLLGGPVKVFNVIARRGKTAASVEYLDGKSFTKAAGEIAVVVDLASLDAWRAEGPATETCRIETAPAGRRVLVRINA